jgi:glycosyltransferase involved in cell wall biosynthesis
MARICMVVHEYYPKDFRVRREAEALALQGHALEVIALRRPGELRRERCGDVEVLRLPVRRHRGSALHVYLAEYAVFFFFAFWALLWRHLRARFEVVHVHSPPDFLGFVALVPRLLGARVVLDIHDRVPELYAERFSKRPGVIRALLAIERAALRFADRIVTVHEPYAQRLVRPDVPAGKIEVVFNSADERLFQRPGDDTRREAAELEREGVRLLHHGTLMERYGVDVLIEAVHRLGLPPQRLRLDVLGEGDLMPRLARMVQELGLQEQVFLHGYMPLDEMAEWILRSDLCVVPNRRSSFTDGILPTKLLEYVAMGRPVVVTRTRVVEHYFREESLCYVPSEDPDALARAIQAFLEDPKPFWDRAENALLDYEPLRWERQAERLNRLVAGLLETKHVRPLGAAD